MNPATVQVGGSDYLFLQSQAVPEAARWFAIVEMQLLDEMTELPVAGQVSISSEYPGLKQSSQRAGKNAYTGLTGIPEYIFRGNDVSIAAVTIPVKCAASGFLTMSFNFDVGPVATYPNEIGSALPVSLGTILMHHQPVLMSGRITELSAPVAGATVELHEFMLNVVTPVTSFIADTRKPVALKACCYSTRQLNDQCQRVSISNGTASDKNLISTASQGTGKISLSDSEGLSAGSLLEIDTGGLVEILEIKDITIVPDSRHINQSAAYAVITLVYPLAHKHITGTTVRHRTAAAAGPASQLKLDALRGDATLLVDTVSGWSANDVIRVSSAAGADEYHSIDFYKTITDADGYYRLPAMNRFGQLSLRASHGVLSGLAEKIIPDYGRHNNLTDIIVVGP